MATINEQINAPDHGEQPVSKNEKDIAHIERTLSPDMGKDDHMNFDRVDAEVAKYTSDVQIHISPEEDKRLRKLIDRRVLAVMVFTYFLQALDKGTMSFTSIMGLVIDTKLVGQQYSWLTTCIYMAILVVEYPTNWVIQRVPIGKYLAFNICAWSVILALHATCHNFKGLVTVRTLLGIFEAACQPIFVVLSSMWYKREEQAATVTYWYMMNGAQQIVGGLLAYCFTLIKPGGPLKSWQAIFITYGSFSFLWGCFVFWWMPDSPMRAKCFSEEDKKLMVERVRSNQTGMQNRKFRREQVIEGLTDPQTYCYCLIAICTTLPTSGLGAFANIIITGFHFTPLQTQLLAMVLGAYIIVVLLSSRWLVMRYHQNLIVMGCFVLPSFVGTIVLMTVNNTTLATKVGLLISYYLTLSFWSAQTLSISMISRNIAGQTKKTVVVAANFICWAAGNAAGSQVFLKRDAPKYFIAFSTHLGCYSLLMFVIVFLRFHLMRENRKKDELAAAGVHAAYDPDLVHAFDDLTDRENTNFRYVY
ncbi:MFS allantoate transporter-like protein [Coleophoma cylindrospora]|uniref:MFS allantoate transporter-like protein n=1 Tax=Coleophoma cylindrospora TaxID=1849047 RepID=A0A3D8S9L6_9HELO|nr:MFS allantoate transporter-like protein [Coleophoma cylindrospora]